MIGARPSGWPRQQNSCRLATARPPPATAWMGHRRRRHRAAIRPPRLSPPSPPSPPPPARPPPCRHYPATKLPNYQMMIMKKCTKNRTFPIRTSRCGGREARRRPKAEHRVHLPCAPFTRKGGSHASPRLTGRHVLYRVGRENAVAALHHVPSRGEPTAATRAAGVASSCVHTDQLE